MKVAILGAGPSGLYLGILLARAGKGHEITVYERNPPDATFGWGVVFSEETLGSLRDADPESHLAITDTFARWDAIDISYRGELIRARGHAFSAIARKRLLAILQARATDLGVKLCFGVDVDDPAELAREADLLVGADGVRSAVRGADPAAFGTSTAPQGCRYIWYGTDKVFDAFRFAFAETEHGLFQVHAYPYDDQASTFIVETPEEVWRAAGLDTMSEQESIAFCQDLFAAELDGHPLLSNKSSWLSFPLIRNRSWHARIGNTPAVLLGDAAHTAHFTIGSGTKLAMEDSIALANAFLRHGDDPTAASVRYEREQQPVVERFQQAAADSADYFSRVRHHAHLEPLQFATNLLTRSGRISHANLAQRDADFVREVDVWFSGKSARFAPPPAFVPLRLREVELTNRVVGAGTDTAADGPGLVLSEFVAVTEDGRLTPETPVASSDRMRADLAQVHAHEAAASLLLGHAGRRGASRSPEHGVDIPLPEAQAWPLMSASAAPYGPRSQVPRAMTDDDLQRVREAFVESARLAADVGYDVLELDCGHGRLLASFLSPLTNFRDDGYGGSLERRLRYPLEVLDGVRSCWPPDRPLAVRLTVTDWARGGVDLDDGVRMARSMADAGADLIHVVAGQTVAESRPEYRRGFLTAISDRIRSEARVPTLVRGHLATLDAINTVLAAGRADLCVADFPRKDAAS